MVALHRSTSHQNEQNENSPAKNNKRKREMELETFSGIVEQRMRKLNQFLGPEDNVEAQWELAI